MLDNGRIELTERETFKQQWSLWPSWQLFYSSSEGVMSECDIYYMRTYCHSLGDKQLCPEGLMSFVSGLDVIG
jgi:hypothetical protein